MSDENNQTLMEELDELYQDLKNRLNKASFLGKGMVEKLAPIEEIIVFVGKVVRKLEGMEAENAFLKEELAKANLELAKQHTLVYKIAKKTGVELESSVGDTNEAN